MINWPDTLIEDIARRRCVIVLGAGVSMSATNATGKRPKGWIAFLQEGTNRMNCAKALKQEVMALAENGDPLMACEIIKDQLGVQAFSDLCREEFLLPAYKPSALHEKIHLIDSRIVLTPNFDIIYESYVSSKEGSPLIKTYGDKDLAEAIRLPGRLILKFHGTINSPHDMVFTRSDYARARNDHPAAYAILAALILTHTFLFIGCGISDPDVALLLEDYSFQYRFGRSHYITLPKDEVKRPERRKVIERTRNLSILPYDPASGHVDLSLSIDNLLSRVTAARQRLAAVQNW